MTEKHIKEAERIARIAHKGQKYAHESYVDGHLITVVENTKVVLEYFRNIRTTKLNETRILVTSWLHDVVEDTKMTLDEIYEQFPDEQLINNLKLLTHSKEDSYCLYITRIKFSENIEALIVKMSDLSANISASSGRELSAYEKQRKDKYELARFLLIEGTT